MRVSGSSFVGPVRHLTTAGARAVTVWVKAPGAASWVSVTLDRDDLARMAAAIDAADAAVTEAFTPAPAEA